MNPLLDNLAIVLAFPKYPENIGAAARSARNMGISRLIVASPERPDKERMLKMATHEAAALIDGMEMHDTVAAALAPFAHVVGTTAREGRQRGGQASPGEMAATILPYLAKNRVALLFGPESRGLSNDDLKFCQTVVRIPTAEFSSLNLAQAVAICCHEIFGAVLAAGDRPPPFRPNLATNAELEGMYGHLQELLLGIGFLKNGSTDYWMRRVRSFFGRMPLRARDVKLLRGFCRQMLWYAESKKQDTGGGATPQ